MKFRDSALSVLSGFLLILAFPNFNIEIVAWFALLPWLWSLRGKTPLQAAFLGFLAGFVFFTGLLYWIYVVLTLYGHLTGPVSIVILILLTAYQALYFSLFSFSLRWAADRFDLSEMFLAPPLWVSLEYLRGILFFGFPWEMIGYSQFLNLPLIQISDLTGVYGVSFMVVLVNATIYRIAVDSIRRSWKQAVRVALVTGIVLSLAGIYGHWKLRDLDQKNKAQTSFSVSLIQGNIPQDVKWDPQFQEDTLKIYSELTRQVKPQHPALIIWPETAAPFFFQNVYPFQPRILELSREMNSPLLFGAPAFEHSNHRVKYFNSAFLISPNQGILGRYDKIHLVPFGEYAPLSGILGFTRDIIGAIGDFSPGEEIHTFSLPQGTFGVLICYEAIFPDLTRQFAKRRANFLVNITNDAWFGRTAAPYQHLSMVTLRAVENRLPIARAANTGISALIDSSGRIVASSGLFTRETLSGKMLLGRSPSFYAEFGDLFVYFCLGFTFFFLVFIFFKRGHRVERSSG